MKKLFCFDIDGTLWDSTDVVAESWNEAIWEKAGIKAGDKIISVNGNEYTDKDLNNISNYIKGEEGTTVKLVIERDGENITFDIRREKINTNPITAEILDGNIGYIKIPSFDEGVAENFKSKYQVTIDIKKYSND